MWAEELHGASSIQHLTLLSFPMLRYVPFLILFLACPLLADEPSSAAPLINLLQSGRLPGERVGTVVEMICQKGNAKDLAYVFGQLQRPDGYKPAVRLKVVELLADAAVVRKVKPEGDLSPLKLLLLENSDSRFKL